MLQSIRSKATSWVIKILFVILIASFAVWGVGAGSRSFLRYVAEHAGVAEADVLGYDLMTHDLTPSRLAGVDQGGAVRSGRVRRLGDATG